MGDKPTRSETVRIKAEEIKVLQLVAEGFTNRQIAERIHRSLSAVEHMLGNEDPYRAIYPKIGVTNRATAARWYIEHYGDPTQSVHDPIEDARLYLEALYEDRLQGNPWGTRRLAPARVNRVREMALQYPMKFYQPLRRTLALMLHEEALAYMDTAPGNEVFRAIRPSLEESEKIAREGGDTELLTITYSLRGDIYCLKGEYDRAIMWFLKAAELAESPRLRLHPYAGIAAALAHLDARSESQHYGFKARALIANGEYPTLDTVCHDLKVLAKAQGLLHLQSALDTLKEAWSVYKKLQRKDYREPIREVQFMQTELEIVVNLAPRDIRELHTTGSKALEMATLFRFLRYERTITKILDHA